MLMFNHDLNDKKTRIMRAATDVFVKKGFCQATVEEIAVAAGVGKGTVYEYFSSKEELFCSIFHEGHSYFMQVFQQKMDEKNSSKEKLENGIALWTEFVFAHPNLSWLLFSAQVNVEPFLMVEEHHKNFIKFITELFQKGIDSGDFRSGDAELMAQIFIGYCRAICGYIMRYPETKRNSLAEEIVNMLLFGLCE